MLIKKKKIAYWQWTLASYSYKNQYVSFFLFHYFVSQDFLIIISHCCSIALDLPPNIVIEVLRQDFQFYSYTYVGTVGMGQWYSMDDISSATVEKVNESSPSNCQRELQSMLYCLDFLFFFPTYSENKFEKKSNICSFKCISNDYLSHKNIMITLKKKVGKDKKQIQKVVWII